jgi:hypothetical protein
MKKSIDFSLPSAELVPFLQHRDILRKKPIRSSIQKNRFYSNPVKRARRSVHKKISKSCA